MFTPNGFVLDLACFSHKHVCAPESSILNVWDNIKASYSCSHPSTFLINSSAFKVFYSIRAAGPCIKS